eukprot:TRINITY_DN1322_c0_g1_i1.p1 TRINITY_DN1322_c0_g1~~TRINITY_DN1322_c0_g1_i1.p1  ORF type:complete len:130 (+),score=29.80 TRINITY_DN1322_c0_g1_i1:201-590(+)
MSSDAETSRQFLQAAKDRATGAANSASQAATSGRMNVQYSAHPADEPSPSTPRKRGAGQKHDPAYADVIDPLQSKTEDHAEGVKIKQVIAKDTFVKKFHENPMKKDKMPGSDYNPPKDAHLPDYNADEE